MKLALIDLDIHTTKRRWSSRDFNSAMYSHALAKARSDWGIVTSPNDESQVFASFVFFLHENDS